MESTIQNICQLANATLQQYNYDPERLGYPKTEIDKMKHFIKYAKKTNLHIEHFEETGDQFVVTHKDGTDWVLR